MITEDVILSQSKNVYDYEPIFEGLIADFGYFYYHAILKWCGILKKTKEEEGRFWEVFLIKNKEEIIGICGLYSQYQNSAEELWLGWFGILPDKRNSGIGAIVLNKIEAEARKVGCKRIYSYVDVAGAPLNFYYRNGFKRTSSVGEYLALHPEVSKENFEKMDDYVIVKEI